MNDKPIELAFYRSAIDDPDTPRSVFTAIGRAAVAWARLEQHLEAVILHINKKEHSKRLWGEHPVSFDNKMKVVKRWFNQHPALLPHKDAMRELTRTLKILSKEARNPLLHSIFAAYDAAKKELTLQSIKYMGDDNFRLREEKIHISFVYGLHNAINDGNRFLGIISRELFSPDAVKRFERPE
jgi:hypothetical protein